MKKTETLKGDLLNLLAQTAKEAEAEETAQLDERWDQFAAGSLSEDEVAALAEEAQGSQEARRNYESFQPLGSDFHDRVVGALQNQPGGGASLVKEPARILPFRRNMLRVGGWVAVAASMAAAILMLIGRPPNEFSPLPEYQVQLLGGAKEERSDEGVETPERRYVRGNRLEIRLRPDSPADGEVAVRCFLARGEELLRWDTQAEISSRGAVRVTGEVGRELDLSPGAWTLWLTLGRPGTLPNIDELRSHLTTPTSPPWSLYSTSFFIGQSFASEVP